MEWGRIPRLNNSNYQTWSFAIQALLRREQLWKFVDPGTAPNPVTEAWTNGDEKALATIQLALEESQYSIIQDKTTAKTTWVALKEHHNKASLGQKVTLLKQITNQNYQVGESMEAYLDEIMKRYARLESSGFKMEECMKVALILRGLPDSFNPLTTALEARKEEELTLEMVKVKLIDEADKQKKQRGDSEEQALKMVGRGKQKNQAVCYFCEKPGHRKKDCRAFLAEKEAEGKYKKKSSREKAKTVREGDQEKSFTFMVRNRSDIANSWVIDSGATSHLANDGKSFQRLDRSVRPVISTADGKVIRTAGVGDCVVRCLDGKGEQVKITLTDVIYAPELEGNLVSVTKLAKKGVRAVFDTERCSLLFNGVVIATGDRMGGLYRLNTVEESRSLMVADRRHNQDCQHVWHRRLGHRNPDVFGEIERKNLVSGMNVKKCGIQVTCECCIEAKMSRPAFPAVAEKTSTEILDIIHSDVSGPMTKTMGGCRYYLTMIDDHSRYTMVYFLKEKSEVETKIREYVRFVENQFGKKPKAIRSDRGGEYTSNSIRRFYAQEGIKAEYTAGYAPQQNGVAERKNRTLNEMGLCMLLDAGLPRRFWAEAVNTAAYLQNRLPTGAVDVTPFEIWFGRKPDIKHLKVFGCSAYVWMPSQKRKKLEPKATKLTFVGYAADSKAYRLVNTKTGEVVISRDVRFLELDGESKKVSDGSVEEDLEKDDSRNVPVRLSEVEEFQPQEENEQPEELDDSVQFFEAEDGVDRGQPIPEEDAAVSDPVRRSTRSNIGIPPERYTDSIRLAVDLPAEPNTYIEAVSSSEHVKWKAAMEEEMASHKENGTWEITDLPPDRKPIGCKWIFKRKEDENGQVARYKARLVAQGFSQKFGTDYDLVFAPVVKQASFRTVLTIASRDRMLVRHVDIKTAYLYGELQEEIYMKQPPGFTNANPNAVCRLRRSLYGLKQAARVWNRRIDDVFKKLGFQPSTADPCLYVRRTKHSTMYLLIYVDDIVVVVKTESEYDHLVKALRAEFKITELGELRFFLGIQVRINEGKFVLNQKNYITKVLSRFQMANAKISKFPMATGFLQQKEEDSEPLQDHEQFQSLVGALLYVAVNTRPDVAIATSILGRRASKPTNADWNEAKRVLRYLKGTIDHELHLGGTAQVGLEAFADADWAGEVGDRKSNTGYIFKLCGGLINWRCSKQTGVSLSSTEAEYIALAECLQELQWIRKLMDDLGEKLQLPIKVNEDNQSCIALSVADRTTRKSKHIDTKYCFVKDLVEKGIVTIQYCPTDTMEADLLTKPLGAVKLKQLREAIGIKPTNVEEEC